MTTTLPAPSPEVPTLYIDKRRCRHSAALSNELQVAHNDRGATEVHVVDIGRAATEELEGVWLPGVPCLVYREEAACGVDAFARIRDLTRSPEGVRVETFSWPT